MDHNVCCLRRFVVVKVGKCDRAAMRYSGVRLYLWGRGAAKRATLLWVMVNYTYIPTQEFLACWHDCFVEAGETIRLYRLGMAFRSENVCFLPGQITLMR